MDLSWLSLLFLSMFWIGVSKIYGAQPSFALYLPLAVFFAAVSFPLRLSAAGKIRAKPALRRAGMGLAQCAVILPVQGFVFSFAHWFFARHHAESLFADVCGMLLRLCGVNTVAEDGVLYISSALQTIVFSSTWEKTGAICFILMLAGGCALLALKAADRKQYLCLLAVTAVYAPLRYSLLLLFYTSYQIHSIFWEPVITLAFFLPYALMLSRLFRRLPTASFRSFLLFKKDRLNLAVSGVVFLLVFASMAFFVWRDPGREKNGRVLVEEYHSDWEWTDEAYDENWFGERSGYNYYCFYEYIGKFFQVSRNTGVITAEGLADTDVLILKTPTSPYAHEEISAILDFVARGGGLYLIGDHTNVFGTGVNLNQIAPNFGISFNYDCTYELAEGALSEYDAPKLFPHPAIQGLPHFLFATSCTLDAGWLTDAVMTGYGLKNLPADYAQKNFFPEDTNAGLMEFGAFVQSAAAAYGKGRVLAFTDSTVYSNFWMHMPGKPELLLKSLQWLNRENVFPASARALAAAALLPAFLALAALTVFSVMRKRSVAAGLCAASALAAVLSGAAVFGLQARSLPIPAPIKPIVNICFEDEYSSAQLPKDLAGFLSNMDQQISTFYVWTQRLGYVPSLRKSLEEALSDGDMAVVVKPGRALRDPERIMRKAEDGARLLILDNASGGHYAGALLARANMRISAADMADEADFGELRDIPLTENAAAVIGGRPVITDRNGNAILSVQQVGKGMIAVFSDPDLFFNLELGDISANLTDKTQLLTRLEFRMMRLLLEDPGMSIQGSLASGYRSSPIGDDL
jgi:hypothetical protein